MSTYYFMKRDLTRWHWFKRLSRHTRIHFRINALRIERSAKDLIRFELLTYDILKVEVIFSSKIFFSTRIISRLVWYSKKFRRANACGSQYNVVSDTFMITRSCRFFLRDGITSVVDVPKSTWFEKWSRARIYSDKDTYYTINLDSDDDPFRLYH